LQSFEIYPGAFDQIFGVAAAVLSFPRSYSTVLKRHATYRHQREIIKELLTAMVSNTAILSLSKTQPT
jgi:hypothetical protein